MYTIRVVVLFFVGGLCCAIRASDPPPLSADQYIRAENLYWQVTARCCLRKPGALKVHQEIEAMVTKGQSDREILAVFASRFGAQPLRLDSPPPADSPPWRFVAAGGFVLLGGGILIGRVRMAARSGQGPEGLGQLNCDYFDSRRYSAESIK